MVAVEDMQGSIRISGLAERPSDVGLSTRGVRLFITVNGRAVRDLGIIRAAEAAYRSTIPAGVRPSLLLQLDVTRRRRGRECAPGQGRGAFPRPLELERAVERAVRQALGTEDAVASVGIVRGVPEMAPLGRALGVEVLRQASPMAAAPLFDGVSASEDSGRAGSTTSESGTAGDAAGDAAGTASGATAPGLDNEIIVPPLVQFHRTYITFERHDALVLIDQHAAHERVLYERFLTAFEGGEMPAQRLLFPLTLHLTPAEAEVFEAEQATLSKLGFEAEMFGGHAIAVHAVPSPHPRFDAERCLRDTLAALTGDRSPSTHARHTRLIATVACKAAVKAGDLLSPEEMRALYLALARTTLAAHDVHGRATILQLGWDELDRRFGRR
jgi:DNA mismatch repair protein MutL